MEHNLCAFCQTIPFRERVYSDPVWEASYRTQEKDGKMILLSKQNFNAEWVSALTGYHRLDVGYKRTDTVPELPSITGNAAAGCHFCKLLLASTFKDVCIETCKKSRDVSTVSISLIYDCKLHDDQFGLMDLVLRAVFDGCGDSYLASYRVVAEENDPCIKLLGIAERPPTIHCDERLPTMKRWINNCEGYCHPQPLNGDVPTRLLNVGSKDKIHLVDCKKKNLSGWRYVALSHCWGQPDRPPIRTTNDSLDERCRHIPFESLPTNYQDAVTVTRGLGLRYLWIDSLCIIQDSITDWEQESTRMHEVYRNAYLTIIAANGNSCHDGFLDLKPAPRVRLNYESSTNPFSKGTYLLWKLHDVEEEIEESQWNMRGWTFQEQRSCDKNLYFTAHDFAYWCFQGFQSMQDPRRRHAWKTGRTSILDYCRLVQQTDWTDHNFFHLFFKSWTSNVEAYSGRIFTNPKDRLPAFSAMAKLLSRSAGGKYGYLAGLWTENLHLWLLWRCKNPPPHCHLKDRLRHTIGSDFIAPSWSWASQSLSVFFDLLFHFRLGGTFCLRPNNCAVKTVEPVIEIDGSNPYGRVKRGGLQVIGMVRAMPEISLKVKESPLVCKVDEDLDMEISLDWMEPDMDMAEEGQQISCKTITSLLMLLLVKHFTRESGLLLLPSGEDGVYFRVGVFDSGRLSLTKALFDDCEMRTIKIV